MTKRVFPAILALLFVLVSFAPAAFAAEDNGTLRLNDAIARALNQNSGLKLQELNLETAEDKLDDMRDSIEHVPATNIYEPGISSTWSSYLSAANSDRIAQKSYENMKQQLVVDVKDKYYGILSGKRDVSLAEASLKSAQIELVQARVKKQVGMMTQADLLAAETQAQNAGTNLISAQNALDQAYTQLSLLTGMSDTLRPEMVDEAVFEKAEFTSLEAITSIALSGNYTVWAAEKTAELADRVEMYADDYDMGVINTKIKEIEASDSKEQLKEEVKVLYQSLQTMEEKKVTLEQKVASQEEALRVTRYKHEFGLATALQELKAEQSCSSAQDELRQLVYEYDLAKSQLLVLSGKDIIPDSIV